MTSYQTWTAIGKSKRSPTPQEINLYYMVFKSNRPGGKVCAFGKEASTVRVTFLISSTSSVDRNENIIFYGTGVDLTDTMIYGLPVIHRPIFLLFYAFHKGQLVTAVLSRTNIKSIK